MEITIKSIFSEPEIEQVGNTSVRDRRHPLKQILFPEDRDRQTAINTERALRQFNNEVHIEWVKKLKNRLLGHSEYNDYSASSSALAEIRAFGYLLESGLSVEPVRVQSSPTTDFLLKGNNENVYIEVHAKQLSDESSKKLEEFNNETAQPLDNQKFAVKEFSIPRFGKRNESKYEALGENTISKLASIKGGKAQSSKNYTSVLWLDFQDEIWAFPPSLTGDKLLPILTHKGQFFTGEFWYAFYGWKGAPIFEGQSTELSFKPSEMKHGNFFENTSNIDAVVISFPRDTVILENPDSQKPIKSWLWKKLTLTPWFRLEYSYINWPDSKLRQRIQIQKETLISLSQEIDYED